MFEKTRMAFFTSACALLLSPTVGFAQQKITFGRFNSRAIFTQANAGVCPSPLVVLVPGSGANGPEEMMPATLTGNGKDYSIFGAFSESLNRSNVATLAIGKPGIDFFKSWDPKDHFYDSAMYKELGWGNLVDNLHDAVDYAKTLPCIDTSRIAVLGHSEGTQVAVDFASQNPSAVNALILVGYSGENLATTVDWQFFRRPIDSWLKPDVDLNDDGFISREEAKVWPEFIWDWKQGQEKVSFVEIENGLRNDVESKKQAEKLKTAKIWQGVFNRKPIYRETASLSQRLLVFTGELDVQTRPEEALALQAECVNQKKSNCEVTIVPGLGHAMSQPKEPRKQKFLDMTLGPVDDYFLNLLTVTALSL
jgi:pimeloyl-ACP methyl ester carboxylesterase